MPGEDYMGRTRNLAVKIGLIITITVITCFAILCYVLNKSETKLVTNLITNQMNDAVESRADIINEYVKSAEDCMVAFAKSDEVRNALLHPDNEEYLERAQQYTVDYASVKGVFEGLYIASTESYIYTHTTEQVRGITTRQGDALKELQEQVFSKDQVTNFGIMKSPSSDNMVISMYYPLFGEDKECIGYVGAAVYASNLMDSLLSLSIEGLADVEYVFLDAKNKNYLYNSDTELLNEVTEDESYLKIIDSVKDIEEDKVGIEYSDNSNDADMIVYKYMADRGWIFIARDSKANAYSVLTELNSITTIASILVAATIFIIVMLMIGEVGRTLRVINKAILKLGKLDLDEDSSLKKYFGRKDELGLISNTLHKTSYNLKNYIHEIDRQLGGMSEGDFTVSSRIKYEGAFEEINDSLTKIQTALRRSFREIATVTTQLSAGSQNVAQSAANLADASSSERNLTLTIEEHVEEIAETVALSSNNALSAKEESLKAAEVVIKSKDKMDELMTAMNEISEAAKEIVGINSNMERIARQTHLLALNASVEATRAGEAGRGFSVVANEIRELAEKSNEAAENAFALIEKTLEAVSVGTGIASETAEYLYEVVEETQTINKAVNEIADASVQQKEELSGISKRLREMGDIVDITASTAEESASASIELDSQVKVLEKNLKKYKV